MGWPLGPSSTIQQENQANTQANNIEDILRKIMANQEQMNAKIKNQQIA